MTPEVGVVHLDIDDELHTRAKVAAATRRETLKALVVRAIEREVERLDRERERRQARREG